MSATPVKQGTSEVVFIGLLEYNSNLDLLRDDQGGVHGADSRRKCEKVGRNADRGTP